MRSREIVQAIRQKLRNCDGFAGDEIAKHREEALNYYFQRLRGDEVPGRSRVVAGDLSAMVEANVAQMMGAFTSDRIVEFEPYSAEDEDQAQLESDAVTYLVLGTNNGWLQVQTAVKEAALMRNGVCKFWIDERTRVEYRTYLNATPEAYAELTNRPGVETSVIKWNKKTRELRLRNKFVQRRARFRSLPLENFLYEQDWFEADLQDIPFCAERHIESRSELKEQGFPPEKVDKLKAYRQRSTLEGAARNPGARITDLRGVDTSTELVEWFECYVLMDHDGDGIAERRRVCLSGTDLLSNDPVNLVPYAAGVVLLNPHRFMGISLHDKLKQTQDKHTALDRAVADNINAAIKPRTAYLDGTVNPEDVADTRVSGGLRVSGRKVTDVRQALMVHTVPDLTRGILENIEALKRERSELGGAALDMASGNMQFNERMGSEGIDRVYSVQEQLAELMTRNIAATLLRGVFLLAHETLRQGYRGKVPVRVNGKWQYPEPGRWPRRECCEAKPGMSPGERSRRANALAQFLRWQVELAREGMDEVLVNVEGFYRTLMDWGRTVEIRHPEQYWVDPASPEAQQAFKTKAAQAAQAERERRALTSQAIGLEQLRTAFEKYKQDTELQFKYWNAVRETEVEEAKIVGKATADLLAAKEVPADAPRGKSKGSKRAPQEPVAA